MTKANIKHFSKHLTPLKGILYFLFLFVVFDFIWKIAVDFGEGGDERIMLIFGKDCTAYTDAACLWTAKATYWVCMTFWDMTIFSEQE